MRQVFSMEKIKKQLQQLPGVTKTPSLRSRQVASRWLWDGNDAVTIELQRRLSVSEPERFTSDSNQRISMSFSSKLLVTGNDKNGRFIYDDHVRTTRNELWLPFRSHWRGRQWRWSICRCTYRFWCSCLSASYRRRSHIERDWWSTRWYLPDDFLQH